VASSVNKREIQMNKYEAIPVSEKTYKATKLGVMFRNGLVVEGSYDADKDQHILIIRTEGRENVLR